MKTPIFLAAAVLAASLTQAQTLLFRDDFSRAADTDLNASTDGQSGPVSPLTWVEQTYFSGTAAINSSGKLVLDALSDGNSGAVVWPNHNFTGLTSLTVTMQIDSAASGGDFRHTGFGIGWSQADIAAIPGAGAGNVRPNADVFIGYDAIGTTGLTIWEEGTSKGTFAIVGPPVELKAVFTFADTTDGTTINYEVFQNGASAYIGSTTWTGTDQNYIGFSSCYTLNTVIDFVEVQGTLPPPPEIVKEDNAIALFDGPSWVLGTAPVSGELAVWDNTVTSANTTVLGADVTWGGIVVEDPNGLVTIGSGNTLTLDGLTTAIDLSSVGTVGLTVNADLALSGSSVWNVAAGRTATAGGVISGSAGIDQQGAGTVILSGANTYAGDTSVTAGTIQLGAADVIPNGIGAGNVSVDGTLDLNGNSETINGLSGAGIIDNAAATTTSTLTAGDFDQSGTFTGILQNSGSSATLNFEKTGSGTIELGSANTLIGSVTVSGGKLAFTDTNPFDNASGIVLDDGTTLESKVDGGNLTAPIDLSGGIGIITFPAFGSTGGQVYTLNLNSEISGAGGLTLFSTQGFNTKGTIVLGAANTYAGDTLINGDIFSEAIPLNNSNLFVELGVENAFPTTTVLTIDGRNGDGSGRTAQVDLKGFNQTLAGLTNIPRTNRNQRVVNSSGTAATLAVDHAANYTFSGDIGVGSDTNLGLTKAGEGIFTLSGTNNYTGTTTIGGGMLLLEGSAVLTSGNLSLGGGGVLGQAVDFTNAVGTSSNQVQWTGSGGFAAVGTNMTVTLAGGNVQWNSGNFVPGTEALILSHPDANRKVTFANGINFAGGQRTIQVDNGSSFVDAEISGTLGVAGGTNGGFTKTGAGTLDLLNTGLYTGPTVVSDGHLRIGNTTALDGTSGITLEGGTRLSPTLDGVVIDAPITLGTTGTSVTINAPTSGTGGQLQTLTLNDSIGGDGNLTLYGSASANTAATIVLGEQSTYAGSTTLDTAGSANSGQNLYVEAGIANALPPTTVLTLNGGIGSGSGRTLRYDLKGFDQTLAGLTNVTGLTARNQQVTSVAPATLTINNSDDYDFGGSVTFNFNSNTYTTRARIQGAISLVKSGGGAFTLVEDHTYTGNTTVNEGILSLGGINPSNESSTVTIAATGATLDLTFTGTDTVDKLFIGTTQMAAGTYGPTATSIPQIINSSGTGTLTVTTGPAAGGYSSWATLNGAGVDLDGDHDGDGVSNGVEYFIGGPNGNTTGFTPLPGVDNNAGVLSVTFTKAADYTGVYDTHYVVEVSTTLGGWSPAPGGTVTFPTATEVKYTFPAGTKNFARLKVTGP